MRRGSTHTVCVNKGMMNFMHMPIEKRYFMTNPMGRVENYVRQNKHDQKTENHIKPSELGWRRKNVVLAHSQSKALHQRHEKNQVPKIRENCDTKLKANSEAIQRVVDLLNVFLVAMFPSSKSTCIERIHNNIQQKKTKLRVSNTPTGRLFLELKRHGHSPRHMSEKTAKKMVFERPVLHGVSKHSM